MTLCKKHGVFALNLRPFQRTFLKNALADGIDTAALSMPRGNGKSWLAGYIAAEAMRDLAPHEEIALCAASIEQARIVFRFIRTILGEEEYRYLDSSTRCAITRADGARLRVIGSNGRAAMGLVHTPLVIGDEPGSWEVNGGTLMFDAIATAMSKPDSPLRAIFIGTLAPARGGWWHDLVAGGSHASTYVQAIQGRRERWDQWPEIRRCNPLTAVSAPFRRKLLEERDAARVDTRLKARFMSYRLNIPTADESERLLTVDDWEGLKARPAPPREGAPIVGLDLGGGRAWSAAVAIWPTGRIECFALAAGIPDLTDQERRDRVPAGLYRQLHQDGLLLVDRRVACSNTRDTLGGSAIPLGNPFLDLVRLFPRKGPARRDRRALTAGNTPNALEQCQRRYSGAAAASARRRLWDRSWGGPTGRESGGVQSRKRCKRQYQTGEGIFQ